MVFDPPYLHPPYGATRLRAPREPLAHLSTPSTAKLAIPRLDARADLTTAGKSAPIGERMVLAGRVTDENGKPVRDALVEVWQANAAGRYRHPGDTHDAPLDPNFTGTGRLLTDSEGRYRFVTIVPGAYPWKNHAFAWRPRHIHVSILGNAPVHRLVTQMYFPGDPLLALDPIFQSVPAGARERLLAALDVELGTEGIALGYRFDIVVGGARATPFDA